jgi:hypothetical protein
LTPRKAELAGKQKKTAEKKQGFQKEALSAL